MLVSLMWAQISSFYKKRKRNESGDLFQNNDLCFSDHYSYSFTASVVTE